MESVEKDLHELIVKGQSQGYLTYDEVNAYLPDEDVSPEKLDNLIIALEEMGVELVNEAPKEERLRLPHRPLLKSSTSMNMSWPQSGWTNSNAN